MPCTIAGAVYQRLVAALHRPFPLHKFLCVVLDCLKCTSHVSGAPPSFPASLLCAQDRPGLMAQRANSVHIQSR